MLILYLTLSPKLQPRPGARPGAGEVLGSSARPAAIYIYIYTCMSIYTHVYVYIHTHIYIYIYTYVCMYIYIYIYIYIYPRTPTRSGRSRPYWQLCHLWHLKNPCRTWLVRWPTRCPDLIWERRRFPCYKPFSAAFNYCNKNSNKCIHT